ncbi:MAG: glycosyltransferase [Magnetococcales bacterium]|nr:glycosyltransferase [Magnetococcales bacterium]
MASAGLEAFPGMSGSPRVTVLTPVYNGERYLEEAIQGILRQTWRDFEFLLIDDASTDATPELLAAWAARDARIRVVRNPVNLGLTCSLNRGIALARGEWIARQDGDDCSFPERLARQLGFLEAHPGVELLGSGAWWMNARGERETRPRSQPTGHVEIAWTLLTGNPFFHTSVIFSRRLALACPYDEGLRFGQDFELWGRMLAVTRGANLAEPLVCSRRHEERVSALHGDAQREIALVIARRRCQGLVPERSWSRAELLAAREWMSSLWPTPGETRETLETGLELFGAFKNQGGRDGLELEALERRVLQRVWRGVFALPPGDRWPVMRRMWRLAGWQAPRSLGALLGSVARSR